jgi:hypothetical protein
MAYTTTQLTTIEAELRANSKVSPYVLLTPTGGVSVLTQGWLNSLSANITPTSVTSQFYPSVILGSSFTYIAPTTTTTTTTSTTPTTTTSTSTSTDTTTTAVTTTSSIDGGSPIDGQLLPSGSGLFGWLSYIYEKLTGTINVSVENNPIVEVDSGSPVTTESLPSGSGVIGWLSYLYSKTATEAKATTAVISRFNAVVSTQICAQSDTRVSLVVYNIGPANLYISQGDTACSLTNFTYCLLAGGTFSAEPREVGLEYRAFFPTGGSYAQITIGT